MNLFHSRHVNFLPLHFRQIHRLMPWKALLTITNEYRISLQRPISRETKFQAQRVESPLVVSRKEVCVEHISETHQHDAPRLSTVIRL